MKPVRLAVIGTGHLGRIHARLAAESTHVDLAAIVDVSPEARLRVAKELGTRAVADHRDLLDDIEAAIVATPTIHHHAVVRELLEEDIHVLVEKPITVTTAEADDLVALADERGLTLQVGHVERFNPGLECVAQDLADVRYLQATRASGFTFRSTDIGVVMDLMIHDIDVALSLARSPVVEVSAIGLAVMGAQEDIAEAQIRFANGCQARLTASRVSYEPARSMQVFTPRGFTSIDFAKRQATSVKPIDAILQRRFDIESLSADDVSYYRDHLFAELLVKKQVEPAETNAIAEEHRDFAESIRTGRSPRVTGRAGRDALAVAERILESIALHEWDASPAGRRGARLTPPMPLRRAG